MENNANMGWEPEEKNISSMPAEEVQTEDIVNGSPDEDILPEDDEVEEEDILPEDDEIEEPGKEEDEDEMD